MTQRANRRQFLGAALGAGLVLTGGRAMAAQATPAASPAASPVAGTGGGPANLLTLLNRAPAASLSATGVSWTDLAAALALANLPAIPPPPAKLDKLHLQLLQNVVLPAPMASYAMMPEFATTFGFAPYQMEQSLQVGDPPNVITLLRGPWSSDDLTSAWQVSGYKEVKGAGGTIWSWADGPKLDLSSAVSQFGMGSMNNAAILADGTIVFAPSIKLVTLVMQTAAGTAASLAGDARMASIAAAAPDTLVSAMLLPGAQLQQGLEFQAIVGSQLSPDQIKAVQARAQKERDAERIAVGPMPKPSFALFGITGGLDAARIEYRFAVKDEKEAAQASKVVEYRWRHSQSFETSQPYTDLLTLTRATSQPEPPVAIIEFKPNEPGNAGLWHQMIFKRDFSLFGW